MTRIALLAIACLSTLAGAATPPPYAVTAEAVRTKDGAILVKVKVVQNKTETVPDVGPTNVETTLSSPHLLLKDGMRAQCAVGGMLPTAKNPNPTNIYEGYQVDIINVKGQDTLFMISTVVEHGLVIWADSATIKVSP